MVLTTQIPMSSTHAIMGGVELSHVRRKGPGLAKFTAEVKNLLLLVLFQNKCGFPNKVYCLRLTSDNTTMLISFIILMLYTDGYENMFLQRILPLKWV